MFDIVPNTDVQFTVVRAIALEVWPKTYGNILSSSQLSYMLEMMYSVVALQEQSTLKQHHFILIYANNEPVGFASYEHNANESGKTKIHKIYILSSQQGQGSGKALLDYIENEAIVYGDKALFLNVNKYNPALHFYQKTGFHLEKEEIIDIGNGFIMDDFVMEKPIRNN
jgi:ribosomal protein S18 acetylase RimI-like enzyme